ncbi:MAG: hypothetical protein ACREJO_07975 [Phycisphaerales bacterium]
MSETMLKDLESRLDAMGDEMSRRAVGVPDELTRTVGRGRRVLAWCGGGLGMAAAVVLAVVTLRPGPVTPEPLANSEGPKATSVAALSAAARKGDVATMPLGSVVGGHGSAGVRVPAARRLDVLSAERLEFLTKPD